SPRPSPPLHDALPILAGLAQNMHHIKTRAPAHAQQQGFHRARTAVAPAMVRRAIHYHLVAAFRLRLEAGLTLPAHRCLHSSTSRSEEHTSELQSRFDL